MARLPPIIHVELYCSDVECTAMAEAVGPVEEIERQLCDCGCVLVIAREWHVQSEADRTLELALL